MLLDSESEFKETVEKRSAKHTLWSYLGSDATYHYFSRSPTRLFIGSYTFYRIARENYSGISDAEGEANQVEQWSLFVCIFAS